MAKSDQLAAEIRYSRSRIRIVRGWAISGVLLGASGTAFIATQVGEAFRSGLLVFHLLTTFSLTVGCILAWSRLSRDERLKIREGAEFLRSDPHQSKA